jgi:hypothetical protein
MKSGIELIALERNLQLKAGFDAIHDKENMNGFLIDIANIFLTASKEKELRVKNLSIAGAYIAAEIDRLNQAENKNDRREEKQKEESDKEISLKLYYWGILSEEKVVSIVMDALRKADENCNTLMSPLNQGEGSERSVATEVKSGNKKPENKSLIDSEWVEDFKDWYINASGQNYIPVNMIIEYLKQKI